MSPTSAGNPDEAAMPTESGQISRPLRKVLRFSVRGLIVVVLVIGGWLGWIVRSARIQREAVAALKRDQVPVSCDFEFNNDQFIQDARPRWPNWMVEALGVDYFGHVVVVTFCQAEAIDREEGKERTREEIDLDIARLGVFNRMEDLTLFGTNVTDDSLTHPKELSNLKLLSLVGTEISDAGLALLNGLSKLETLFVSYTAISDAGLVSLAGLTKLTRLYLANTDVTDTGLRSLKALANLTRLDLIGTHVTDAGVKDLQHALLSLTIER
jgi:Leucine rich repeat